MARNIKKEDIERGQRLREIREYMHLTQDEVASRIGFQAKQWYHIKNMESGNKKITPELAKQIGNYLSINDNWLLHGEGNMLQHAQDNVEMVEIQPPSIKKILPVYEYPVAAGYEGNFEENQVEQHLSWFSDADFVMKITGTSMLPLIPDGAYAGIKRTTQIIESKPQLVRYQDEQGNYHHAIKYVKNINNHCELISANKEFRNIVPCGYLEIIGTVVDIFKKI